MYFDFFVLGLMIWGIADSFMGDDDEPEIDDSGSLGEIITELTSDLTQDPATGDEEEPAVEEDGGEEYVFVDGATTVTLTDSEGVSTERVFDSVDIRGGPTIQATDGRDTIEASDNTGFEMTLDAGGGDDTIDFGYGASVDPGDGVDIMSLSVTQNALASDSEIGTIDLTDEADALTITFEDETPPYLHAVRGSNTETVDGVEIRTDWIDIYASEEDALADAPDPETGLYAAEAATRVVRLVIGSSDLDASVNDDPSLLFNRPVASEIQL